MKAILIKGIEMPNENGFLDIRVYGDGSVVIPCCDGNFSEVKAEETEVED